MYHSMKYPCLAFGVGDIIDAIEDFLTDWFGGRNFFKLAGWIWNSLLKLTSDLITKNPTSGTYKEVWNSVTSIYTVMDAIAASLLVVFFLYGFCRESCDLHNDITFDRTIKLFIRLIVTSNILAHTLTYMKTLITWSKTLTKTIIGDSGSAFKLKGGTLYDNTIGEESFGVLLGLIMGILFFAAAFFFGMQLVLTVMNRMLKIYMIAPFAGIAVSTIAAGGQTAQIGYTYIKTFIGYVFSVLLIAVVLNISTVYIETIVIESDHAILGLFVDFLKMAAISSSVKMADNVTQKAFGL